jgi:hypothetical protein
VQAQAGIPDLERHREGQLVVPGHRAARRSRPARQASTMTWKPP